MPTPFLAEIRLVSFNFPPAGWAFCNGQLLQINQNQALFSLLGTIYGGDGRTTFALPNLQGRAAMHLGNGWVQGERFGEEFHTLTSSELPAHTHLPNADPGAPTQVTPAGGLWAAQASNGYTTTQAKSPVTMGPSTIANVGGSQPHNNLAPYTVLNFIIALQGIFPSQN